MTAPLEQAEKSLAAARLLTDGGFNDQAVAEAYYATFYAAEAAIEALGLRRAKHSGVHGAFGRFVVREGGFDPAVAKALVGLFDQRKASVYGGGGATTDQAANAIADAERFVAAVRDWLAAQPS